MFERVSARPVAATPPVDAATVGRWRHRLAGDVSRLDDRARVDLIRALEDLKSAASAAQARVSVDLDDSQRAAQREAGVASDHLGRGVAAQVALARRESPHAGGRYLGLARALVTEMPHTLSALASGTLSEWRATLLARESACLTVADRAEFDRSVCADARTLVGLGTRALVARARQVALRLDQKSVVERSRRAESDRCVTLRPAPDTMTYLTALLPVAQGVATYAALLRAADVARGSGDPRGRGQAMADELVARVTGGTPVTADGPAVGPPSAIGTPTTGTDPTSVRLDVQLVMTDRTLLAGDGEERPIPGYGTVPGPWARDLVLRALDVAGNHSSAGRPDCGQPNVGRHSGGAWGPLGPVQVWVRRLFTHPDFGRLVAMDSRARLAPPGLAALVRTRDSGCRTPYCDAPARHIDHVVPHADDGPTSAFNLQGKCESCNHAKQAPGWRETPVPRARGEADGAGKDREDFAPDVVTVTPTGHRYVSRAPALPGPTPVEGAPVDDVGRGAVDSEPTGIPPTAAA